MKIEKAIQELDREINFYITKWFTENNKQSELFELLWWRNFLQFATWLTEKERVKKLEESNILVTHIYLLS